MSARTLLRRNARFRRLLTAQAFSDLADWLDYVAIVSLLAYAWQVESFVYALLAVALGLPYVVIGPLAGALADRLPLRAVMVASNLGKAAATAGFALAGSWPLLFVLIVLRGGIDAFFTPARQATIQAITAKEDHAAASGASQALNQVAKVVAPALGGLALALVAAREVFLLNAAISATAGLMLLRIGPVARAKAETGRLGASIRASLRLVAATPALRAGLMLMSVGFFGIFVYDTYLAPLVRGFGFDQTQLGFVIAGFGAGGALGAVLAAGARANRRPFLTVALSAGLSGAATVAIGLGAMLGWAPAFLPALPVTLALGIATSHVLVPIRTVLLSETAPERMASVTALSEAANTAAMLTAPFLGAAIAHVAPLGAVFVTGGALGLANAGLALAASRTPAR